MDSPRVWQRAQTALAAATPAVVPSSSRRGFWIFARSGVFACSSPGPWHCSQPMFISTKPVRKSPLAASTVSVSPVLWQPEQRASKDFALGICEPAVKSGVVPSYQSAGSYVAYVRARSFHCTGRMNRWRPTRVTYRLFQRPLPPITSCTS